MLKKIFFAFFVTLILMVGIWVSANHSYWKIQYVTQFNINLLPTDDLRALMPAVGKWLPVQDQVAKEVLKTVQFKDLGFENWSYLFVRGAMLNEQQSSSVYLRSPPFESNNSFIVYCYRYPKTFFKKNGGRV